MRRLAVLVFAAALATSFSAGCAGCNPSGGGNPSPRPSETPNVPEGYRGIAWGTPRAEILKKYSDVRPGKNDPRVLVHDVNLTGKPATEAFFFDAKDGLEEVEVRYGPKLTPLESGTLGLNMDKMFGTHDTPLADEDKYQYAWIGEGTEVRLTYDLAESVVKGPVIAYTRSAPVETATPGASPSPTIAEGPADPAVRFGDAVRAARASKMRLVALEAAPGKLTLIYSGSDGAQEISLTSDPRTGKLFGAAALARAPADGAALARAESAIDEKLAKGNPLKLTFGGPTAALKDFVSIGFANEGFLTFDPKAADPLASSR